MLFVKVHYYQIDNLTILCVADSCHFGQKSLFYSLLTRYFYTFKCYPHCSRYPGTRRFFHFTVWGIERTISIMKVSFDDNLRREQKVARWLTIVRFSALAAPLLFPFVGVCYSQTRIHWENNTKIFW